jgi:peptide/nickel transport system substrate-binding protein
VLQRKALVTLATVFVLSACQSAAPSPSEGTPTSIPGGSAAPASANPAAGTPVVGGILRVARSGDVLTWDPPKMDENDSLWASVAIFSTLMRASADGKELEPYLAQSVTPSADYKQFTFKLDPNAAFCDGSKVTSADVVFSWERAMKSDAVSWMFPEGLTMDTPDDQTFVANLESPNVALPWWSTLWGMEIVSKAYAQAHSDEEMASQPLGSGPFCLKKFERGSQITLERNTHFWLKDAAGQKLPYVDGVEWLIVPDANSRTLKLQSGEIDIAEDIPFNQVDALKNAPGIEVDTSPLLGEATIWLNQRTPFKDPKIRQAANYAVDKESLIDIVLQGFGQPAYSFLYLGKYTNEDYGFRYDLDKAKALMAESSAPNGFDAELLVMAGDSTQEQAAVVLKDQLAKIGINITITPLETGTFSDRWFKSDFDMLYKLSTLDIYDSSENLNIDINDAGFTGWKDEDLWAFAQAAAAEPDETKRAEMFDELQKRYMEAPPQLPLFHPENAWAHSAQVEGYRYLNTGLRPFITTWLSGQ